jgi:hypothetical protein
MVYHIQGEEQAQIDRGELEQSSLKQSKIGANPTASVGAGVMNSEMKRANPAKMIGAEGVPTT